MVGNIVFDHVFEFEDLPVDLCRHSFLPPLDELRIGSNADKAASGQNWLLLSCRGSAASNHIRFWASRPAWLLICVVVLLDQDTNSESSTRTSKWALYLFTSLWTGTWLRVTLLLRWRWLMKFLEVSAVPYIIRAVEHISPLSFLFSRLEQKKFNSMPLLRSRPSFNMRRHTSQLTVTWRFAMSQCLQLWWNCCSFKTTGVKISRVSVHKCAQPSRWCVHCVALACGRAVRT